MTKYWIIIAKRYRQTLEIARNYIENYEIWDFVANNDKNITPNNASQLRAGHRVLFYLAKKDRHGYSLGRNSQGVILYRYPIFFARATLDSDFIPNENPDFIPSDNDKPVKNYVKLKEVKLFKNPIRVFKPKEDWEVGAKGPTMLVEIKDYHKYERVCIEAGVNP